MKTGGRDSRYPTRKIVEALQANGGSLTKTAKALDVTRETVKYHVQKAEASGLLKRVHGGCLARWLRTHPGAPLPRSTEEIATMTGCTEDAVKSYLKRQRRKVLDTAKSFGDLREAPDFRLGSRLVQPRHIATYDLGIDPYSFLILVKTVYKDGEKDRFYISLSRLKEVLSDISND